MKQGFTAALGCRTLKLRYQDGEKMLTVRPGVSVVVSAFR